MEKRKIRIVKSGAFFQDIQNIYDYGVETFGISAADAFLEELIYRVECLSFQYEMHPECRYLQTKKHIYRNIIFGSYLIIYRIKINQIEVLKAINSKISIKKVRSSRKIKPE